MMRASELIEQLTLLQNKHGDMVVNIHYSAACGYENVEGEDDVCGVNLGFANEYAKGVDGKRDYSKPYRAKVFTLNQSRDYSYTYWRELQEIMQEDENAATT